MSIEKLKHLNDGDKIYVEMVRQADENIGILPCLCFASGDNYEYIHDDYIFYTEEQIRVLPDVPEDRIVEIYDDYHKKWDKAKIDRFDIFPIKEYGDISSEIFRKWRIPEKKTIEQLEARIQELEKLLTNK